MWPKICTVEIFTAPQVGDGLDFTHKDPAINRYVYVLKTDANGNEEWRLILGTVGWNYGKFAIQLDDDTFVLSGAFTAVVNREHVLHRGLVHIGVNGTVLQGPMLLPVQQAGRQEGFTGIALAEDGALVATGFYNAYKNYPDEAMFLVYGQAGLTKFARDSSGQWSVAFDILLNTTGQPFTAAEGMRVLYDETERVYVMSHTVQLQNPVQPGTFEFGISAFTLDGKLKWTRAFPAQSGNLTGLASHPYALTLGNDGSYAIGGLAAGVNVTQGRLVSVTPTGDLQFDRRFHGHFDYNIECYGVQPTRDGGYILTCGYGLKSIRYPNETDYDLTWRALVQRTDSAGEPLWQTTYGNRSTHLSNAGEYIISTRDGGYAVYIDSKEWGNPGLGGSFALLRLMPDTDATSH